MFNLDKIKAEICEKWKKNSKSFGGGYFCYGLEKREECFGS